MSGRNPMIVLTDFILDHKLSCLSHWVGLGQHFSICDRLGRVGLGNSVDGFGWVGSRKMDPWTTLYQTTLNLHLCQNCCCCYETILSSSHRMWPNHTKLYASCLENVPTFRAMCLSNISRFQWKNCKHVPEDTSNKSMWQVPTLPKICASTTFGNLK